VGCLEAQWSSCLFKGSKLQHTGKRVQAVWRNRDPLALREPAGKRSRAAQVRVSMKRSSVFSPAYGLKDVGREAVVSRPPCPRASPGVAA